MCDPSWVGAVVTLPHKRTVIPLLDDADEHAKALRLKMEVYGGLVSATEQGKGKSAMFIGAGSAAVHVLAVHIKDVTEAYTSTGLAVPSIMHVTFVEQARFLSTPYYIVGTVPDFSPMLPTEITTQDILLTFLQRLEKGIFLNMCYKPRETRYLKFAKEEGWKSHR
ncbi:hypothetical protein DFS33DRAFT_1455195 [Desarmillaria ectypa]|nr:hypothetical protein DFS33DRAFT_1455195 [Desarmillaria ectypa]